MDPIEFLEPGWTKVVSRKQKRANMLAALVKHESKGAGAARSKRQSTCYGDGGDDEIAASDEKKVVSRKQKPTNMVAVYVEDESNGADAARSIRRSNCYGDEIAARDENLKAEETKKLKPNKDRYVPKESLQEAAANIYPSDLALTLTVISEMYAPDSPYHLLRFVDFLGNKFYDVQFSWPEMFRIPRLFRLEKMIDVPFSYFPESVYKTASDWINQRPIEVLGGFVLWAVNHILSFLAAERGGPPHTSCKSKAAIFVALAMVLRSKPYIMAAVSPTLRLGRYQGPDKLPVLVWMMAQASQGDLSVGLFSWAHNLLPVVSSNPQTRDLCLQLVENILLYPNARTILVNGPVRAGKRVIPPPSFEILLRLTFPASSARVKATERFEAIYPLLKEVALAGAPGSKEMKEVTQEIFTLSLKLAKEGNPDLAKEATAIAIWCVTENVDCCKHWEHIYKVNLVGSAAVLKKLVDEWKDHSLKLSSSRSDTLTLNQTMKDFMQMNERAINRGEANGSLYKEADESCKVILERLSRGSGCLKGTAIMAVVLTATVVLSFNLWFKLLQLFYFSTLRLQPC